MAVLIQAGRQFSYHVATLMAKGQGAMEASMVKAYVCKAAEWVTREAMQIHGGFGYAEEYTVSRLFVDARVLSIFEGADETLCLKVIARRLTLVRLARGLHGSVRQPSGRISTARPPSAASVSGQVEAGRHAEPERTRHDRATSLRGARSLRARSAGSGCGRSRRRGGRRRGR